MGATENTGEGLFSLGVFILVSATHNYWFLLMLLLVAFNWVGLDSSFNDNIK